MGAGALLLDEEIRVNQALVTSGEGRDYSIFAKSKGIPDEDIEYVESRSIPSLYIGPKSKFKDAVKVFPLPSGRVAISFINTAGRDEFNRPARMRSHVFVVDRFIYNYAPDPEIYRPLVAQKDLKGELDELLIKRERFFDAIRSLYMLKNQKIMDFFNLIDKEMLFNMLSAIFLDKKVVLYAGEVVNVSTTSDANTLTGLDFIKFIILLVPMPWRWRYSYTTFSSNFEFDDTSILFYEKGDIGATPSKNAGVFVDLAERTVKNHVTFNPVRDYVDKILHHYEEASLGEFLFYFNLITEGFKGLWRINSKHPKESYKIINKALELSEILIEKYPEG